MFPILGAVQRKSRASSTPWVCRRPRDFRNPAPSRPARTVLDRGFSFRRLQHHRIVRTPIRNDATVASAILVTASGRVKVTAPKYPFLPKQPTRSGTVTRIGCAWVTFSDKGYDENARLVKASGSSCRRLRIALPNRTPHQDSAGSGLTRLEGLGVSVMHIMDGLAVIVRTLGPWATCTVVVVPCAMLVICTWQLCGVVNRALAKTRAARFKNGEVDIQLYGDVD